MNTAVKPYEMNPAEDTLVYGDELTESMWVMPNDVNLRYNGESEEAAIRAQRFCRITRLRDRGDHISFIGVYVDGFQRSFGPLLHKDNAWIVKRENVLSPEAELGETGGGG